MSAVIAMCKLKSHRKDRSANSAVSRWCLSAQEYFASRIVHVGLVVDRIISKYFCILDFKLSPCFECRMFAFGLFPGVCILCQSSFHHCPRLYFYHSKMNNGPIRGRSSTKTQTDPITTVIKRSPVTKMSKVYTVAL
jgi:hypothetical protein